MKIIDMHCDTIWAGRKNPGESFYDGNFSVNGKFLKENDALAQFFALYIPRREIETTDTFDTVKDMYKFYLKMLEENRDIIAPALSAGEIRSNASKGLVSSFLTIEDGTFIDGKLERIDEVYDMGVRLITPLWNYETSVGFPNSRDPKLHARGLKPFGIDAVRHMNDIGIIVDVSHLSEGGFYDVAKYSKKSFVASHSCARALCSHQRNLTDDQLKTLGQLGGVVGVNFERSFLNENSNRTTISQIIEHLLHMKDKAGIEAIGFGSDFDGIEDNGEMENYGGFGRLLGEMEKAFTGDEIDKICNGNVMRIIEDIVG